MSSPEFKDNFFKLFGLPVGFDLDQAGLRDRYRQLQGELHPDRYAGGSDLEQRMAVQYSALVNEAYATLRKPLDRALYLLQLVGLDKETVARQKVDGGFLIAQMEWREKLESIEELVDPDTVLEHVVSEIGAQLVEEQRAFAGAYSREDLEGAAMACVRMQYLDKLLDEAELLESTLMDG
ncbi:MAG: Fe-S protein assembly co-chaperone HscB [Pseudomonadota bacterium]